MCDYLDRWEDTEVAVQNAAELLSGLKLTAEEVCLVLSIHGSGTAKSSRQMFFALRVQLLHSYCRLAIVKKNVETNVEQGWFVMGSDH